MTDLFWCLWCLFCAYSLGLAVGPLIFCGGSFKSILRNDPFRWQLTIPSVAWPACRKGYFRWSLPPIVIEFWDMNGQL